MSHLSISDFSYDTTLATFTVTDGKQVAVVTIQKSTGKVVKAEAVGGADRASCFSFADEAAAWLSARAAPKRIGRLASVA